jgi:capsular exopolysaccharide synthesis family protein
MNKERKNIPILNEKIDPYIILYILKRSVVISVIYFLVCIIAALIYIRYTPPLYKASSIIQLKDESNTNILLELTNKKEEINLNQTVELLRSAEFLKRTISKLPLDVSYYAQGTFLEFEMYRSSPFKVEYEINNASFYNNPIFISFTNNHAIIRYELDGNNYEKEVKINEWFELDGLKLKIKIINKDEISEHIKRIKKDAYFIILNEQDYLVKKYSKQLNIFILNQEANTIQISFTDKNALKVAEFVKTMAEEFILFDIERKIESSKNVLTFIDQQTKMLYKTIDSLEEQLLQYRYQSASLASDNTYNLINRYDDLIKALTKEIEDIEIKLLNYDKFIKAIESNPNLTIYEIISLMPDTDPILMSIINKIQSLEEQKEQLLASKTTNSFQIKAINNQLEKQQKTLIDILKTKSQRLNEKKKLFADKLKEYSTKETINNPLSDLDYLKIKRMYEINVGYYNKLLEKKAEFLINKAGSVSQNIILQNALIPSEPITSSKETIILIFSVIAVIISLITIVVRYLLYNEITSVDDINTYTSAKILGIIPLYKAKLQISQLLIDIKPNSIFTESFRACRASIEFLQKDKSQNVISISSTISGEGKTFFAINLAGIFSLQNKRVILLDLDLRRPRIHLSFNSDNSKGISTILAGKNKLEDCIKTSKLSFLDFITAGPVPPNPSELINSPIFEELIKKLSANYDYVIIDTPPLGLVSDALSVFKISDFPVYVIKSHFSKRTFLYNINHLIEEKNIEKLLVVVNGFDYEKSKYGYQYAYSYNYGYGYTSDSANHYYEDVPIKKQSWLKKILSKI